VFNLKSVTRSWFFWLLVITGIAIFLRSIPGWLNAAWGCDFGIYYGLTNSFVESKELFNLYSGWGSSYQYFPVLYAITGVAHFITGIDVLILMPKIAPIFGGLSVLIFYFIVYELLGDRKIAILSCLFLAVLPFHVYQTSQAAPMTMGHFFIMLSMYLFIKYRQNVKYVIPLFISTVLLIMSHHLTTYFYLISLIGIVFVENFSRKDWTLTVKLDVSYIVVLCGLVFSYWIFVATPVYESFMKAGITFGPFILGSNFTIVLFYMLFFSCFGVIWLRRRLNLFFAEGETGGRYSILKFSLTFVICLGIMCVYLFFNLPGTNFSFTPLSVLYAVPLLLVFGLGVVGFRYTRLIKNGFFIRGWIVAILLSFIFGFVTNSNVILPHRHLEYLMVPLSIVSVYGLIEIFNLNYKSLLNFKSRYFHFNISLDGFFRKTGFVHKKPLVYLSLVVFVLVASNAASVYSFYTALNVSYEGISNENLSITEWMKKNLDKNCSVIASDHRLSRMAESAGFNTTIDLTEVMWHTENLSDYVDELKGVQMNYSKITHVIIDDVMRERVVNPRFKLAFYMTNESYEKFLNQPFELVYRNASYNRNLEEVHWAEIFMVNWTYIDRFTSLEKKNI